MNSPTDLLGEADFTQSTRSYGIGRNPWLSACSEGARAGVRFNHFKRIPEGDGNTKTPEKLMNQTPPRQQPMPDIEELKEKWPHYVAAARVAWGEITEDELLNLKSHTQQLAGLIHDRYAVTREEADMQVRRFFTKHRF